MALLFTAAGSQRVDIGSGTSIDNVDVGTDIFLAKPTSASAGLFYQKGTFAAQSRFKMEHTTTDIFVTRDRATTDALVSGTFANFANYTNNTWMWFAAVWNMAGANGDQKLYVGSLTAPVAEPSSYGSQLVGSGATGDNSSANGFIGNQANFAEGFPGVIARVIKYNVVLTLDQLKAIQFGAAIFPGRIGHWELGFNGTGTQPDWSGNFNAGTVTGATQAAHAPVKIFPFGRSTAPAYTVAAGGSSIAAISSGYHLRGMR